MREFQVGDRIERIKGQYIGATGVVINTPAPEYGEKNVIWIRFDDPSLHGGRIYKGYASYVRLISAQLPEDAETIDV